MAFSRSVLERTESNCDLLVWGVIDRLELFIPLTKNVLCSDNRFYPKTLLRILVMDGIHIWVYAISQKPSAPSRGHALH